MFGLAFGIVAFLLALCLVPRDPHKVNFLGAAIGGLVSAIGGSKVASAAIGAGAALLGGAKDRKAQKAANAANRPASQVRQWEKAGVNPIVGITQGNYVPVQASSIGDAYSQAGSHIARAFELDHQEKLQKTELAKENEELREKLDELATPRLPSYMQRYGGVVPAAPVAGGDDQDQEQEPTFGEEPDLEEGRNTLTNPSDVGSGKLSNPRVQDTEVSEARFGDIMSFPMGVRTAVKDRMYNYTIEGVRRSADDETALRVHRRYANETDKTLDQIVSEEYKKFEAKQKSNATSTPKRDKARTVPKTAPHQNPADMNAILQNRFN